MTTADLVVALRPVVEALAALGVRHFIGGSVACSAHGIARASLDVDVVAELEPQHVAPLVAALSHAYYVDSDRVRDAVATRRSFNVIHLATMFKVDVFVSKQRPFDESSFARARHETLGDGTETQRVPLASAEDVLVAKLEWFRRGGETSERQWEDVIGLLRVGKNTLDQAYLQHWAALTGVADLLQRARTAAE